MKRTKAYLTAAEVAERLDLHPDTVRLKIRRGEFTRVLKTTPGRSGRLRVPVRSVELYEMKGMCNATQ